ncbi:response regulator transcription factor [Pandoraea sp.]|uniref:response regulator transcription factor n=1 Tax=Pandoraea sp. TaxID=1883445 RepID=UPI00122683A8|nr:MAG: response regulator transcription factor [Pandoraea sp.]TAM17745.1 MAG: response regulator transcription factor [Pandoraea sp.]
MKLLVVEDNHALVANLFAYFEARGHILDAAPDGATGLRLVADNHYDAVVLDWTLPRMDGMRVLQALRQSVRKAVPVLMLTAKGETADKVEALGTGADDYLVKPFDLAELEARLLAQIRRASGVVTNARLQVCDLALDLDTTEVTRAGQMIALQPATRRLLEVLMRASPALVPRERLEEVLWGDAPPDRDLLRSQMHVLRRAIDAPFARKLLHTVPRVGYRLTAATDGDEHEDD